MRSLNIIIIFISMTFFVVAQESVSQPDKQQTVIIITNDGSEIIGVIKSETNETYFVETPAGLSIDIPKKVVVSVNEFSGKVDAGKIFHADPNKSMYLFAPSAFPIGEGNGYCRDFCVLFPSINYGLGNIFSLQAGAFWFPGMRFEDTPLVGSAKMTLLNTNKTAIAGGIMYIKFPSFDTDFSAGAGFSFITGTYGDQFSHFSISGGWGFIQADGEWDFMSKPIFVLAGNKRISNTLAIITENWIIPELDFDDAMLSLSMRYFGRKIAVDVGGIFSLASLEEGMPFPVLNFTYHFSKK